MNLELDVAETADLHVENIGGIEETAVSFSPGVTVLEGRNATNRTSLLQAIAGALGSDGVSLKGDADDGSVELALGETTYERRLRRETGTVHASGDPYLSDPTLADLFAFLLESNEARRAVARGDDLRDLIMRPIDTDEIQAQIDRLVRERRLLDEELEDIDSLKGDLPDLEAERSRLTQQIEAKRDELAEKEAALEAIDATLEESREAESELEETLAQLREKRAELDDVRYDLETEQERLQALESERNELRSERDDLPDTPAGEVAELESEIERLRSRKQRLQSEITDLQSVIEFNEEMLDGETDALFDAMAETPDGALTDQLVEEGSLTCWTCGSEVEDDQIRRTIEQLRELNATRFEAVSDLDDRLDSLTDERQTRTDQQSRRDQIERRLGELEEDIASQNARIEEFKETRETLREEITALEKTVENLEGDAQSDVVAVNKAANQIEYELGRLENELDRVDSEISDVEARLDEREQVEAKRETIQSDLAELRTKIDRIEREAIEGFNEHMETVLDLLAYENVERIWLERVEEQVRQGRRTVAKNAFELHVVRSTVSGTTYEDTVDHLSESEREVTGLVFALAGYLVHDVFETVPFMLLDSLEAIDSDRIAALIDHFAGQSRYLVVALLPEDARALDEDYDRVTDI